MADISKCKGGDGLCMVSKTCYRFTAPNSEIQSWTGFFGQFMKYDGKQWFCTAYIDNRKVSK